LGQQNVGCTFAGGSPAALALISRCLVSWALHVLLHEILDILTPPPEANCVGLTRRGNCQRSHNSVRCPNEKKPVLCV